MLNKEVCRSCLKRAITAWLLRLPRKNHFDKWYDNFVQINRGEIPCIYRNEGIFEFEKKHRNGIIGVYVTRKEKPNTCPFCMEQIVNQNVK